MPTAAEVEKPQVPDTFAGQPREGLVDRSPETGEVPSELEQYVQRVEEQPAPVPVTDDKGQALLTPTGTQPVTITLPLTQEEMQEGLRHPVVDAIFWIAKWCKILLKKAALVGGRVVYRR